MHGDHTAPERERSSRPRRSPSHGRTVTGSSGFIGGHVLRILTAAGHDVVGFDRAPPGPVASSVADEIRMIRGDITDPMDVSTAITSVDPDRIIHLAAVLVADCRRDSRRAIDVNVRGTVNVLEAARAVGVGRVAAASSVNVYGRPEDTDRITEATVRQPTSTYGMTKYVIEWLGRSSDVDFAALELVHGFGPHRLRGNAYDTFVVQAAISGKPVEVPRSGVREEFLYVEDGARALVTAATADEVPHDRYLVGTDQRATLAELVDLVTEVVPEADLRLRDADPDGTWSTDRNDHPPTDSTRIRADLGWEPTRSLPEMVESYVAWLVDNPAVWDVADEAVPWEH